MTKKYICGNCKGDVGEDSNFCPSCGGCFDGNVVEVVDEEVYDKMKKPKYPSGSTFERDDEETRKELPRSNEKFFNDWQLVPIWSESPSFRKYNMRGYDTFVNKVKKRRVPAHLDGDIYKYVLATPQTRFINDIFPVRDEVYRLEYIGAGVFDGWPMAIYYVLAKEIGN